MELLISRGQPWASSRLPVHFGPGGRPHLPQLDTHSDWTAFILNNKGVAHLNVPQMTNTEDANRFTLQICRSPQAGNQHSGGLCATPLSTLIRRFNCVEESPRAKLRCGRRLLDLTFRPFCGLEGGQQQSCIATPGLRNNEALLVKTIVRLIRTPPAQAQP